MPPSTLQTPAGTTLAYAHTPGRTPTLVFLPGFRSDMTGEKATMLAAHAQSLGHASLRLDYSGHGASTGAFEQGTIGLWTQNALEIIDHATQGPLLIVGSSMGGWIALLVALARPARTAALIGIAPAPDFTETLIWQTLDEPARAPLLRTGALQTPSPHGTHTITALLIEEARNHLLLHAPIPLTCPIRLIHGQRDADVPWQTSLTLANRLTSPDVQITLIKDAEHRLSRPQDLALLRTTVTNLLTT